MARSRSKTADTAAATPELAELRFEAALGRLESLVEELDGGELDLEDSLAKFEEGIKLVRLCSERLANAKVRIAELERTADGMSERPISLEEAT